MASVRGSVALVQGASRGMGLEYVKQLLLKPDRTVFATCRSPPESISALQELKNQFSDRCFPIQMDCTDEASIQEAFQEVQRQTKHLDLLINVAGVLHRGPSLKPGLKSASDDVKPVSMMVNAMGPALVMKQFSELMIQAEKYGNATQLKPAVIANMSARVSSLGDNALGGWYSYRASKCALNQLTKCFAIEMANKKRKVACVLLHPGTVDTDMSLPFRANVKPEKLFSKERAVQQLLRIVESADMGSNGKFFAWDGTEIDW